MSGRVKLMAYDRFIRAAGYVASAITLMLFLANQVNFLFLKKPSNWEGICSERNFSTMIPGRFHRFNRLACGMVRPLLQGGRIWRQR